MAKRVGASALGVMLFVACCAAGAQQTNVAWEPDFRFAGTFFPSYAIATAGRDARGPVDRDDAAGFIDSGELGVRVKQAPPGARLKVEVTIPQLEARGEIESSAPADGKAKVLVPRLSLDESKLVHLSQPENADAVFRVFVNGDLVGEKREPLRIRAINDAPLTACSAAGSCHDYSPLVAAFVNEDNPSIDAVLRAALNVPAMPVKTWTGTQLGEQEVLRQVWALWYLFQRSRMTYSSITTVSEEGGGIASQTVRPLSQSLRTQQANCVDGTVLFASILRKIGIEPTIVLVPGHAFLGFTVDGTGSRMAYLETTMLNDAENPFAQRGPSKLGVALARATGTDLRIKQSQTSFDHALQQGQREFAEAAPNFGKQRGYALVRVKAARAAGILPLPL
jgi:hypothetical protein